MEKDKLPIETASREIKEEIEQSTDIKPHIRSVALKLFEILNI